VLISRLVFYRHDVKFDEIDRVLNTGDRRGPSFRPYGFALIHNEVDFEYYKSCIDSWFSETIDNYDFDKFSYLITFNNPVKDD